MICYGKKHFTVLPMGILNAHAIFVCVMTVLRTEWTEEAKRQGLNPDDYKFILRSREHKPDVGSKVIVDDGLLFLVARASGCQRDRNHDDARSGAVREALHATFHEVGSVHFAM